jgi:hypothetical protein
MSKLENAAVLGGLGSLAAIPVGVAYQGDKVMQERKKKKEDEKIEEMKRKQEPSGGESESKSKPLNYKTGGKVSSASKRADGCAIRGKTKGRMV